MADVIVKFLKITGLTLMALGLLLPLLVRVGGEALYHFLAGNSAVPNQNALVIVGIGSLASIALGIVCSLVGGGLFALGWAAER
ncbi:MAG TPA: hypothetical protein VF595_05075 [Tepidisphaeraceae bacterium]|jgi:hypothetical protein